MRTLQCLPGCERVFIVCVSPSTPCRPLCLVIPRPILGGKQEGMKSPLNPSEIRSPLPQTHKGSPRQHGQTPFPQIKQDLSLPVRLGHHHSSHGA